jgi:hypothetical protein
MHQLSDGTLDLLYVMIFWVYQSIDTAPAGKQT